MALLFLYFIIYVYRYSPNEEQYQWIAYILLWKLLDSKLSNVECNIQTQLDCIQIRNALELCGNITNCLHEVFF